MEIIDPNEIWTTQEDLYIETKNHWAKLRVRYDKKLDQNYYDVIAGIKGQDAIHVHQGFTLTGNLFFNEHRDIIPAIHKTVDSSLHGKFPDETIVYNDSKGKFKTRLSFEIKDSSRESKVVRFEVVEVGKDFLKNT